MLTADIVAKSGEAVKSGPIGLAVILVLCVVCYFLFKSMSKHLRTVREKFPAQPSVRPEQPPADDAQPVDIVKHGADQPGTDDPPGS